MASGGKKAAQGTIELTTPKTVLQVFHNVVSFGKEENNATAREALCRWQEALQSRCGEVEGESLALPQALRADRPRFERSDLLILNDYNDTEQVGKRVPLHEEVGTSGVTLLQLGSRSVYYEIFQLRREESGLELHLAYTPHAAYIGATRRSDYQVARLEPGRPLRVTINGKLDFSASGRRARSYQVRDYLFLLLGDFDNFTFLPETTAPARKCVPLQEALHVDLREILY